MTHAIEIRKIPFDFTAVNSPLWNPTQREWSHMLNGASLTMPYLEPFLNRTMREALPLIEDMDLRKDVDGFIRQEAQHYTTHKRYNELLKTNGYPKLEEVEHTFSADYDKLDKRSLTYRLAYSAGFETMTMGVTEWLVNDRDALFHNADPTVSSFVLWHMVEETEHKSVAYDVFQSLSGKYWLRVAGLLSGSLHVGLMSRRAYILMLKQDGLWKDWRSRLRLWQMVGRFFLKAGTAMVRALRPSYHPDKVSDPEWVKQWQLAYGGRAEDFVPLLDTRQATIRPSFA